MAPSARKKKWLISTAFVGGGIVALILLWDWNWFRPLVASQLSQVLGRNVSLTHFNLHPGRITSVELEGVHIAQPDGFPVPPSSDGKQSGQQDGKNEFAHIERLEIEVDVLRYVREHLIAIPRIALTKPALHLIRTEDNRNNWTFPSGKSEDKSEAAADKRDSPEIGTLQIEGGTILFQDAPLKADVSITLATGPDSTGKNALIADAKGSYAGQPMTGGLVAGDVLTLRQDHTVYPLSLHLENGPTKGSLRGTIADPLHFAGADLTLTLKGADMAALYPLTGIPIPQTPPYDIKGHMTYAEHRVKVENFTGHVGSSDLNGSIIVDPSSTRPVVTADLYSRKVDLDDLGGFIGSTPGKTTTPGQTAEQKKAVAKAEASPQFFPTRPISIPKLKAADIHLRYKSQSILGRSMPLDNVAVVMDIVDGHIQLHPLSFGIGKGDVSSTIDLAPDGNTILADASISFHKIELQRLLKSVSGFTGGGLIGGEASIKTKGNSVAQMLGHGDGYLRLTMGHGGNISALLVSLSGLQFGNAVLSALGIPSKAQIRCMIADYTLKQGVMNTQLFAIDTTESDIRGTGIINLRTETLDYAIRTEANHFTIGSLPTPINIGGTFKNPSITPGAELGIRAGAAIGLGILFPPLALLPTIQTGIGSVDDCKGLVARHTKRK
ncbi:AsmA family protein [Granulibacter bethesdensis]|uniref:AsmA family protein n=1 Tax=Granulibacter bethesdensis TaxID=364410 RepID=A0AAC9P8D5_9PROT|nr:AsmA family protein [Granulibacter bethesdensis]APH54050.1 AsmA family protein [Granulibacter bethesdensis]APH61632.1 AsmA family protein [Granulibacter bethesdensis]